MRRVFLCLGLVAALWGCTKNHDCREGTVFVTVNFSPNPSIDGIAIQWKLDNGSFSEVSKFTRIPNSDRGGLELQVSNYLPDRALTLRYTPTIAGVPSVADWREKSITLAPGCAVITLNLEMGVADAGPLIADAGDRDTSLDIAPQNAQLSSGEITKIAFNPVPLGVPSSQKFTITNIGSKTSSNITLEISVSDFKVQATTGDAGVIDGGAVGGGSVGDCISGVTILAPRESCTVSIIFQPSAEGKRTGTISFTAAIGGGTFIELSGTGGCTAEYPFDAKTNTCKAL
jgi:hypothetical protein